MDILYACYALGIFITGIFIAVDIIDQYRHYPHAVHAKVGVDKVLLAVAETILWPITMIMGLAYITRFLLERK